MKKKVIKIFSLNCSSLKETRKTWQLSAMCKPWLYPGLKKKTATEDTGTIKEIQILNTILGNRIHVKFPACDNCNWSYVGECPCL